jgi:hypothetical protein
MADFCIKPSETDFLSTYSQATDEAERRMLKEEYQKKIKAYWDWMAY